MNAPYTLQTPRLLLEPMREDDVDAMTAHWREPDVRRYLWDDELVPKETVEAIIADSMALFENEDIGLWMLRSQDGGKLAGFTGFTVIGDTDDIEINYSIATEFAGQGLATEAAAAAMGYGFHAGGLERIWGETDPPNAASVRVLEKLGMAFVEQYTRNGLPTLRYCITREDWDARQAKMSGDFAGA